MKMNGRDMNERSLSENELDARLESPDQMRVRNLVQSLGDEPVSMAWRSELNEKILSAVVARQRKRRFAWILSPALGLGVAGALAVVLVTKTPEAPRFESHNTAPGIEANLVASFKDSINYTEVTGVGLNADEAINGKSSVASYDSAEVDLGSL
jgi:hypothetical protein